MKIKPYRDAVLVKADEAPEKTKSGLYFAEQWKTVPLTGVILAVGEDVKLVQAGDRILFMRYGAIKVDEDERLVKERHIFAGVHDD